MDDHEHPPFFQNPALFPDVVEEKGPVSGYLPRGHAFECKSPCSNIMCTNFDPKVPPGWAKYVPPPMPQYGGAVLTKELIEESFEAMRKADSVITIDVRRADGRVYRIHPASRLRRLWNWLRGYRRPA